MPNSLNPNSESIFQRVCRALDSLFIEGLKDSKENAELWQEWRVLRTRLAKSLIAGVSFAPVILVTFYLADQYTNEIRNFPDFIRVVLVEAVICMALMSYQTASFLQCLGFSLWLKRQGLL